MPYQGGGGYGSAGGYGGRGRGSGGGGRFNDDGEPEPNSEQLRKLYVGGLSYETDEDGLRTHFEQWGEIVDCVVIRDSQSKKSRGFGFITYKEATQIDDAQAARPHKIDNREVETKRAMPRDATDTSNQQTVKKLFVGGMKDDTTEDQIREVFSPFGKIDKVDVITDKATGKIRGFAFIEFDDYDPVDKAVLKKRHDLNGRKVGVKKAVSKDQMNSGSSRGETGIGRGGRNGYGGGGYGADRGGYESSLSSGGGGYGGGGYGSGGYGGGYSQQNGYGGSGGGYGDYNLWGSSGGGGFGSKYNSGFGGGPMKGSGYSSRGAGPYGGSSMSAGGGGSSYGGGYNRR